MLLPQQCDVEREAMMMGGSAVSRFLTLGILLVAATSLCLCDTGDAGLERTATEVREVGRTNAWISTCAAHLLKGGPSPATAGRDGQRWPYPDRGDHCEAACRDQAQTGASHFTGGAACEAGGGVRGAMSNSCRARLCTLFISDVAMLLPACFCHPLVPRMHACTRCPARAATQPPPCTGGRHANHRSLEEAARHGGSDVDACWAGHHCHVPVRNEQANGGWCVGGGEDAAST